MLDASNDAVLQQSEYGFDLNNNVTKRIHQIKGQTQVNEYTYGKDNLLMSSKLPNGVLVSNTIDRLNRVEKTTLELPTPKVTSYTYSTPRVSVNGSTTTTQLHKETIDGEVYEYRYDAAGNITEIWKDDVLQSRYGYDDLYQLVTEYDAVEGTETRYTYDNGGNILNRYVVDAQTGKPMEDVDYGYDAQWKDKLVSYDGQPITYDPIGNPLNYLGYAMTWQRGRQLASLRGNGVTAGYRYNADGMRVNKAVNGVAFKYYYEGTQLLAEERGSDFLQFYYSGGGIPVAFNLNGVVYYYQINSRGDITGIYDANGTLVVEYTYDAWGNPTGITGSMADTVGQMNPLRYRGYYYDVETGFYYIQTRYYNPAISRFLNADVLVGGIETRGLHNIFRYSNNNPVMYYDPDGREAVLTAAFFVSICQIVITAAVTMIIVETIIGFMDGTYAWELPTYNVLDFPVKTREDFGSGADSTVRPGSQTSGSQTKSGSQAKSGTAKVTPKAETKAKEITKAKTNDEPQYSYWAAVRIKNSVIVMHGLTYTQARLRVEMGLDLMCRSRGAAFAIIRFYRNAVGPEIHGSMPEYYWHYHIIRNTHQHIWYYGV